MALLTLPPDDRIHRWAYSALGRSFHVAASFESDCRALVFSLKVRDPALADRSVEDFAKLVGDAVLDRLVNLNKLIATTASLPENYRDLLTEAREARNYVAHEASDDLDRSLARSEGFEAWRTSMAERLEAIAIGKIIIAILLSRNSAEATPTKEAIETYSEKVKTWALHAEGDG